jgi:hypothetical protein
MLYYEYVVFAIRKKKLIKNMRKNNNKLKESFKVGT